MVDVQVVEPGEPEESKPEESGELGELEAETIDNSGEPALGDGFGPESRVALKLIQVVPSRSLNSSSLPSMTGYQDHQSSRHSPHHYHNAVAPPKASSGPS